MLSVLPELSDSPIFACSGTLYAGSGRDRTSLSVVQNGHRGYPAGEYAKLAPFGRGNDLFAMVSCSGKYAVEGRTN